MTSAISMVGPTKHYKGVQALTDLTLDVPARHDLRIPRPERGGQDYGPEAAGGSDQGDRRKRRRQRRRRSRRPASIARSSATSPRIPASTAVFWWNRQLSSVTEPETRADIAQR